MSNDAKPYTKETLEAIHANGFPVTDSMWATVEALAQAQRELEEARANFETVRGLTQRLYGFVQNGAGCCGPSIGRGSRLRQVLDEFDRLALAKAKDEQRALVEKAYMAAVLNRPEPGNIEHAMRETVAALLKEKP